METDRGGGGGQHIEHGTGSTHKIRERTTNHKKHMDRTATTTSIGSWKKEKQEAKGHIQWMETA